MTALYSHPVTTTKAYQTMSKLKNIWNGLSGNLREQLKSYSAQMSVMVLGSLALTIAAPALAVSAATMAVVAFGITGFVGTVAGFALLPDTVREVRHGQDKVTWKNTLGQTIKSTLAQKIDLEAAQYSITKYLEAEPAKQQAQSIAEKFQSVASKVSVVTDIENGNGQFRFARYGVTPLALG